MAQPPKRPPSAFLVYVTEERPAFMAKHPDASIVLLAKLMAHGWQALPDSARQAYAARADADKAQYEIQMLEYNALLGLMKFSESGDDTKSRK